MVTIMKKAKLVIAGMGFGALLNGCTWVPLDSSGSDVQVFPRADVVNCERKGKVTVTTAHTVGGIARGAEKVKLELITLARNEGGKMGGNVVSAESEPSDGRQVFGVYNCPTR